MPAKVAGLFTFGRWIKDDARTHPPIVGPPGVPSSRRKR
jgi:hypothetical protein